MRDLDQGPFASVIIPVYNSAASLVSTLEALQRQTYSRDQFETIVVDNGSVDDIAQVRSRYPQVLWLLEEERGSYRSRNRGIRAARGEVLAFTDSDCIPEPGWIEQGVRSVLNSEKVGLAAGRVKFIFERPQAPSVCELYDSLCSLQQQETLQKSRFGATANLFTRRKVMEKIGLFDEQLISGGDREWGNRVFDLGLRQIYCAEAVVLHPAKRTLRELIKKSLRITAGTMVAGPDTVYSTEYFRRHLIDRPREIWRRMATDQRSLHTGTRLTVLGLYFVVKALQAGERTRVLLGGQPRR
jgi:glycosyltransferase involved in cell wall biosynthesis